MTIQSYNLARAHQLLVRLSFAINQRLQRIL
jgi:hypothetical protein